MLLNPGTIIDRRGSVTNCSLLGRSHPTRRTTALKASIGMSLVFPLTCHVVSVSQLGCPYDFKCLFLSMPRVQLFHRIDARCEAIIEQGLFPVSYREYRSGILFTISLCFLNPCTSSDMSVCGYHSRGGHSPYASQVTVVGFEAGLCFCSLVLCFFSSSKHVMPKFAKSASF